MPGFAAAGLLLGLSGGLAPGPLLALVTSETLRHGVRAGIAVALAPLLTDPPIVLAALLVLRPLADQDLPLALLHLGGGLYLAWLSLESLRFRGAELPPVAPGHSLRRGVIANILNPNPYLFWLAVGAPTVLAAWRREPLAAIAFVIAFYLPLVGSKVVLALLLGRVRHALRSRGYVVLMRGLGGLLLVYALLLLCEGGRRLAMG
ncbi:MAG: LysE family transporter [Candidatus Competibacteraceae bacterium]|nr:MAG: LysE family transporter [Candidatus Competibacteraceae bacterium]